MAVLTQSQGALTLSLPAEPLSKALADIAQKTGDRLLVSPQLANEVVMIDVHDVAPTDLLAKIASTVGGRWADSTSGKRLDLDTLLDAQDRQLAVKERTTLLKGEIDQLSSQVKQQGVFDPAKLQQQMQEMRQQQQQLGQQGGPGGRRAGFAQMSNMQTMMPGGRAVIQSVVSIRVDDLARIGPGQRVVFSSIPTQMQRPLPGNPTLVARTFLNDQAKMIAQGGMGRQRGNQAQTRNTGAQQQPNPMEQQIARLQNASIGKSYLIVTRFGDNNALNCQYIVADTQGAILGSGDLSIGDDRLARAAQEVKPALEGEKPVELSPLAKTAAQVFSRGTRGSFRAQFVVFSGADNVVTTSAGDAFDDEEPAAELVKSLRDPESNDPLNLLPTEAIRLITGKDNLVALLPDSVLQDSARSLIVTKTPSQLGAAAKDDWGLVFTTTDGWTTVAPKHLFEARESRVNRSALKGLIDIILSKGVPRLDDMAKYAVTSPISGSGGLDQAIVGVLDPASVSLIEEVYGTNRDMLLMWSSMGQTTRNNLAGGKQLPVNNISVNAMKLLADMVYNSVDGPQVTRQGGRGRTGGQAAVSDVSGQPVAGQVMILNTGGASAPVAITSTGGDLAFTIELDASAQQFGGQQRGRGQGGRGGFGGQNGLGGRMGMGMGGNISTERTEVLPTGVPGGSFLVMSTNSQAVAKGVRDGNTISRLYTARQLAMERAMSEMPAPQGGGARPMIAWSGFISGNQTRYVFTFNLAPGVTLTRTLTDTVLDGQNVVAQGQLPAAFTKEFQQVYDQMRQRFSQMGQQGGRGAGPGGRRGGGGNGQEPPPQ